MSAETNEALHQRIDHNLTNHAPVSEDVVARFEALREFAKNFSHAIVDLCPESRDRSLALTHAEDALMRAVAAIARNQEHLAAFESEVEVPTFDTADDLAEAAEAVLTEREVAEQPDEPEGEVVVRTHEDLQQQIEYTVTPDEEN